MLPILTAKSLQCYVVLPHPVTLFVYSVHVARNKFLWCGWVGRQPSSDASWTNMRLCRSRCLFASCGFNTGMAHSHVACRALCVSVHCPVVSGPTREHLWLCTCFPYRWLTLGRSGLSARMQLWYEGLLQCIFFIVRLMCVCVIIFPSAQVCPHLTSAFLFL
jgi:hypothetical protein